MINYIDLGVHRGGEIDLFIGAVSQLGFDYRVYGVEANPYLFELVSGKYADNPRVKVFNIAISEKNAPVELYIEKTLIGSSIFPTKNNVDRNKHVTVPGVDFFDWFSSEIPNYNRDINILKFNIEGAELYLMKSIVNNGISERFSIYLGNGEPGWDIKKCAEIADEYHGHVKLLHDNGIRIKNFCAAWVGRGLNVDLKKELVRVLKKTATVVSSNPIGIFHPS